MSCFPPQELFKLQKSLPSSRFLSPAEIYPPDRVKFTVICVSTSTGSPFKIYGLYRHCLTASIAAGASMGCPLISVRCRSEEHTSELQSRLHLVCRLLLEKKKTN